MNLKQYTECNKLVVAEKTGHSQLLGAMLDWMRSIDELRERGINFRDEVGAARWKDVPRDEVVNIVNRIKSDILDSKPDVPEEAEPQVAKFIAWYDVQDKSIAYRNINSVLADFFGIDMNKVEEERQHMLASLRAEH